MLPQAELEASASRCQKLRWLAREAMHSAAPCAVAMQAAGPQLEHVEHQNRWQDRQPADDGSAAELAPRLLTALKAQRIVWQRVKVALLSHFAGRLRAQLAAERAKAAGAAAKAEQREAALDRRLQDAHKVPRWATNAVFALRGCTFTITH